MTDEARPPNPILIVDRSAALKVFHEKFGKTMAAWTSVEEGLFEWFKLCSGMHEQLARGVYYSTRGFAGRRDMLIAAIPFSPCDEKTRQGIRLCAKRARKYSEFRNRIAHGNPVFAAGNHGRVTDEHVFKPGHTFMTFGADDYVTISDLEAAAANFASLGQLLLGFHPEWQAPDVCEAGCLAEIRALPTEANSTEPSRPQT